MRPAREHPANRGTSTRADGDRIPSNAGVVALHPVAYAPAMTTVTGRTRAHDRLIAADREELPVGPVCEAILLSLHDVARFDLSALMTTDPDTMLPSGGVVEGFEPTACSPFWDNELLDPDFNKFTDLVRSLDHVATLADAVDGDLMRSPRYQKIYGPIGATDELRAVFMAGSQCLAIGAFLRPPGMEPFTDDEVADVRALLPLATHALRRALGRVNREAAIDPPVVLMLDGSGQVTGMTAGGSRMLEDLHVNGNGEGPIPNLIRVAATRARWSRSTASLTTRLRGKSGRWLRVHVSPMEGDAGAVAVTVESAGSDDLVPILLESYGLTERETEIALRLCRGLSMKEIAAELIISPHTVRDYVKTIYEKAEVNSRGELVAHLFSNHVIDRFESAVTHVA